MMCYLYAKGKIPKVLISEHIMLIYFSLLTISGTLNLELHSEVKDNMLLFSRISSFYLSQPQELIWDISKNNYP